MPDHTVPHDATKAEEAVESRTTARPDTAPTPEEEAAAESHELDPRAAKSEEEFNKLGAEVKGEGEIP